MGKLVGKLVGSLAVDVGNEGAVVMAAVGSGRMKDGVDVGVEEGCAVGLLVAPETEG